MTQTAADVALRATLLLGVSWATASVLEKAGASAARRYAVWLSGFAALALLLPCMWLLPRLPVPILPAQVPFAPQLAAGPPIAGPLVATMDSISFLELIYLAIGVLLLGRIAVATLMIERLWRRAAPLRNARILEQAAAISASLGVRRDIAIRIADREVVPMTWGSVRPRIVLPQEALGWGEERWHSVLLHELGHVYRHDSL